MESASVRLVLIFGVCLSVAAIIVASGHSFLYSANSDTVSGASEASRRRDGSIATSSSDKRRVDSVLEYYQSSHLSNFVTKHKHRLPDAKRERKRECGSIMQVSSLDCEACSLFVSAAKALVESGSTQDDIIVLATKTCIDLEIEDERVCKAAVMEFKEELFGTLLGLALEPREVCGYVLGTDCGAPYNPNAMWNVTFPDTPKPPVVPPALPKPGSPTFRVLHLTDFHLDPKYTAGSNAECGEPLCCRANDGQPKPGSSGAGKYGDYRNCDSANTMMDTLFQHLASIQDQFDYVFFTGDIPPHNVWNQSRSDQTSAMETFTKYVRTYLPKKTLYPTLGNHEGAPVDSFPPPFIKGNASADWLYQETVTNWLLWLPQDTAATILKAGYYSVTPFPGYRIISLNMNMCNNMNWWLLINTTDPANMLQWFISELQQAEDKGEKVHILGHIYPGCSCCLKPWSWNYYKIVNRYESTIVGQFFGHTHSMTYEMIYDDVNLKRPLGVVHMPGSITTYSDLNPGFRIYEIDGNYKGSSWQVLDYTNYYLNLTAANIRGQPVWEKEYSAKEAYGLSSLFPEDWNNLIFRMKTDDQLFITFCRHVSKSAPNNCDTCKGSCRKNLLCGLKTGRNGDPNLCKDL